VSNIRKHLHDRLRRQLWAGMGTPNYNERPRSLRFTRQALLQPITVIACASRTPRKLYRPSGTRRQSWLAAAVSSADTSTFLPSGSQIAENLVDRWSDNREIEAVCGTNVAAQHST
jgi:hypothetical protein